MERIEVDTAQVEVAFTRLGLATITKHEKFAATVRAFAREQQISAAELLSGLSHGSTKNMKTNETWPASLPRHMAELLFREIGIDVTPTQNLAAFHDLEFDIRLEIPVTTANSEPGEPDRYSLDGMTFEIAEAHAELDDGEALTDVRIGFDKARLGLNRTTPDGSK